VTTLDYHALAPELILAITVVATLVVVPAAGAKNLAGSMKGYLWWSIAIATAGSNSLSSPTIFDG